jgi:uncharacterized membrane protein
MKIGTFLVLLWIPRIICILVIAAISLFACDAFGNDAGFWKTLLAFLTHLLPTFLMIFILYLSWKRAWIGGIVFLLAGIAYILWKRVEYPIVFIPLFLVGILFLLSWFFRKEIEKARAGYEEG